MRKITKVLIISLIFISVLNTAHSAQPIKSNNTKHINSNLFDLTSKRANIYRPQTNQHTLSNPSKENPKSIVQKFLQGKNFHRNIVSNLNVIKENKKSGLTHLRLEQNINGLTVYGAYVKATVNKNGELTHLIENIISPSSKLKQTTISNIWRLT